MFAAVSFSSVLEPEWYVAINMDWLPAMAKPKDNFFFSQTLMHTLSSKQALLSGVPGITDFFCSTRSVNTIVGGKLKKIDRPVIVTQGSNLKKVLLYPGVDTEFTVTNDVLEIYEEFGLDACAVAIEKELAKVTNCEKSISVTRNHLYMMASYMTNTGIPCALSFSGMKHSNMSNLKKATFERIFESMINAGVGGDVDDLNGICESNLIGTLIKIGTGQGMDLIRDPEKELQLLEKQKQKESYGQNKLQNRAFSNWNASVPFKGTARIENLKKAPDPVYRSNISQFAKEYTEFLQNIGAEFGQAGLAQANQHPKNCEKPKIKKRKKKTNFPAQPVSKKQKPSSQPLEASYPKTTINFKENVSAVFVPSSPT